MHIFRWQVPGKQRQRRLIGFDEQALKTRKRNGCNPGGLGDALLFLR
jgi:hypothetical protein